MTITVGCPQTNRKTDTGKTLKPWPVLVDHYIVTYKPMHKFLNYAKKNSSLRTLMQEPSRVLGLEARIEEYKPITHASLLILTSEKSIKVNDDMSVEPQGKIREENANAQLIKYARKLAIVFNGENVVSVYRSLGLKSL
ncbi:three component ABC system middle component [Citrobacter freundii]